MARFVTDDSLGTSLEGVLVLLLYASTRDCHCNYVVYAQIELELAVGVRGVRLYLQLHAPPASLGFLWVTGFSFFHCVASPFHSFVTTARVSMLSNTAGR